MKISHIYFSFKQNFELILRSSPSQMFFKILQNSQKTPVLEPLFNKAAYLKACNFIKKRLQHRCSCEYCEIFMNTSFYRTLPVATSGSLKVQSCKLYNNKYVIGSTQTTNTEIFAFIALLVFKGAL